jgi:hypothetical protein
MHLCIETLPQNASFGERESKKADITFKLKMKIKVNSSQTLRHIKW